MSKAPIHLVAANPRQFDPVALDQLERTAAMADIARVVGLPDLHAGRGIAVGAAYWSPAHVYPHLVGSDIGCGMALWQSDGALRKFRLDAAERKLHNLDGPWDGDPAVALASAGLSPSLADASLGTIGGGNHFVELQRVEEIVDAQRFDALDLDADRVWMMVHSGSRGLGHAILESWTARGAIDGLAADGADGQAYLAAHDQAAAWAVVNREVIAARFFDRLGLNGRRLLDICHNSVTPHASGWLHRKGAAPADGGLVAIPGSRGDFSYLVEPITDHADTALHSLAHGAGRKWSRSDARARLSTRFKISELERTALGSRVICEDRQLIYEEAPQAYKDIRAVVADLEQAGLVRVIARLRPLISYKTRRV